MLSSRLILPQCKHAMLRQYDRRKARLNVNVPLTYVPSSWPVSLSERPSSAWGSLSHSPSSRSLTSFETRTGFSPSLKHFSLPSLGEWGKYVTTIKISILYKMDLDIAYSFTYVSLLDIVYPQALLLNRMLYVSRIPPSYILYKNVLSQIVLRHLFSFLSMYLQIKKSRLVNWNALIKDNYASQNRLFVNKTSSVRAGYVPRTDFKNCLWDWHKSIPVSIISLVAWMSSLFRISSIVVLNQFPVSGSVMHAMITCKQTRNKYINAANICDGARANYTVWTSELYSSRYGTLGS